MSSIKPKDSLITELVKALKLARGYIECPGNLAKVDAVLEMARHAHAAHSDEWQPDRTDMKAILADAEKALEPLATFDVRKPFRPFWIDEATRVISRIRALNEEKEG